jgi:Tol biopolymer transport system component
MLAGLLALVACRPDGQTAQPTVPPVGTDIPSATVPLPSRVEHEADALLLIGERIELAGLTGRIVFDDFETVYSMNPDGTALGVIAGHPGAEFDGSWSPDGQWVVYRDSTRGINDDDEIYVARADGSERRNVTNNPANDWGPDWSPDGTTIAFNSDRGGGRLGGYLIDPDGSNVRPIDTGGAWFEYPSWAPDGTHIAFMGHAGSSYDIFTLDLATSQVTRVAGGPTAEGWPVWSPDGTAIAFTSERDDCAFVAPDAAECWRAEPGDVHRDTWLVDPDGTNLRRVTPAIGQFLAWAPDSSSLLISGHALYVVRPDGTGSLELRTAALPRALGGIPDWWAP